MERFAIIKNAVERMEKANQLVILKILTDNEVDISENKNGTFVNLGQVHEHVLVEIERFIHYLQQQTVCLDTVENAKVNFKEMYFTGE